MISLIVAVADNGVVGVGNGLPWRLPNDLQRFKSITMGKPIVMGRKTFASIGKPLPGRRNVVITRDTNLKIAGCTMAHSLDAALQLAGDAEEIMIIGGAEIYRQALPHAQRVYLTEVHAAMDGDARFPQLSGAEWREVLREDHAADDRHAHAYSFVILERAT
ncbi:MAG TPA: type 3 dihydrofolate reductase [Steroidobacteraceae bacterium]|nr:type 3 dihydrofolate reductase [Steroidobacteraceae bacterium]